ncbi:MAG: oligosaccharide flippase family protein [Candidatus Absconditabacterales bacterium]
MEEELLADQPLGHKLIKKGFRLYFFMIITAPVGYLIRVIVSNTLSIEDIGIFYSVLGFITLVSVYHDLGLTEALQYFLPKYRLEKKYDSYKSIFILTLIAQVTIGILIACAIYFGADWLAIHHFRSPEASQILRNLAFYFIGINFISVFLSIYNSFQDAIAYGISEFTRMYTILGFTLVFRLTKTLTVDTFSISRISGILVGLIVIGIIFLKKYRHTLQKGKLIFSGELIKTQLKYAFRVFLGANIGSLLGQVDQQIVINLLGPKAAGYYSNYFSLIGAYTLVISPLLAMVFPIVTELVTKKDKTKLHLLQNTLYKYFSILALSIGGIFFAFGPEIASILFGTKFYYSGQLLMYSAPFLIINVMFIINFGILAGLGKVKQRVKILGIALLVNVVSNIVLLYYFKIGLPGAVISTILGWILLWGLSLRLINRNEKISYDRLFFIKNLIIIATLSIACFLFKGMFMANNNSYRWHDSMYLVVALILYYSIIGIINYKSIHLLSKEIKVLKRSS